MPQCADQHGSPLFHSDRVQVPTWWEPGRRGDSTSSCEWQRVDAGGPSVTYVVDMRVASVIRCHGEVHIIIMTGSL